MDGPELLADLRARFAAVADPLRAAKQAAYMKSSMPYHGVDSGGVRAVCKAVFAGYAFGDAAAWRADVRAIWQGAAFREERYAAIELAAHARARPLQGLPRSARAKAPPHASELARAALAHYERMIVEGAWWDLVDTLAAHRVGALLAAHPALVTPEMVAWARSDDLWKRRSAIICQLGRKQETDLALLREAIALAVDDPRFWLRKAIGWALREYAKTDPAWVRAEVAQLGERLSGLSRREALKHLG